jgi:hypothetical protein
MMNSIVREEFVFDVEKEAEYGVKDLVLNGMNGIGMGRED